MPTGFINILVNLSQSLGPLLQTAIILLGYLIGLGVLIWGLFKLAASANRGDGGLRAWGLIAAGAAMLNVPGVIQSVTLTLFGSGSPSTQLSYLSVSGDAMTICYETAVDIIEMLGWAAALRGLFCLGLSASADPSRGYFWKGITHLVGGALAVNIVAFVQVLAATLGISLPSAP